uniref:Uncharacterized protein n=1 Tax=Ascaris lumbricoides TaxID=6252 RepID=A0A0M3IP42_ASCLU
MQLSKLSGATPQKDSSVWIAVDTDVSNKQMTRIDFIETFHPLSLASAINRKDAIKGYAPARISAPSPRS